MPELKQWEERWKAGHTQFHCSDVHEFLLDFKDKFLVKKKCRIFVPLCGKTVDMKWMYDEGHEVIGVEGVEQACIEFFQEQNLSYTKSDVLGLDDGKLYRSSDGRIKLYKCDFFQFTKDIAGCVDAVWDRGSIVAVDPCDRQKYRNVIISLLNPGARILLEQLVYNPEERSPPRPPHSLPDEAVKELYGEKCTVETFADKDVLSEEPVFRQSGMTWMRKKATLLTLK